MYKHADFWMVYIPRWLNIHIESENWTNKNRKQATLKPRRLVITQRWTSISR